MSSSRAAEATSHGGVHVVAASSRMCGSQCEGSRCGTDDYLCHTMCNRGAAPVAAASRTMCRDELLLKVAILGLVSLHATPLHMATLLQCYRGKGHVGIVQMDKLVACWL